MISLDSEGQFSHCSTQYGAGPAIPRISKRQSGLNITHGYHGWSHEGTPAKEMTQLLKARLPNKNKINF